MSTPITKATEVRVRSVDEKNFTVEADVSGEAVDRHGEIILLSAWSKRLDNYMKNPLLCWQHPVGARSAPREPQDILGKALEVEVQQTSLYCKFQYAVDQNPRAKMCFDLIAGDYLRSYSIGAIPYGPVYADAPEMLLNMLPPAAKEALLSGEAWCVHTDMELLEISNVFCGSYRDALARACRDGVIQRSVAPELFRAINASSGNHWPVSKQIRPESDPAMRAIVEIRGEIQSLKQLLETYNTPDELQNGNPIARLEASLDEPGKGALVPEPVQEAEKEAEITPESLIKAFLELKTA
jgi:hypothetical protein